MNRKIFSLLFIFIVCLVFAFPAMALDQVSLRLDWLLSAKHMPFFMGNEKGFFKDAGIDLQINEGKGSGTTVKLVGSGADTFGVADISTSAKAVYKEVPVKVVYVQTHVSGYSILSLNETGIKTPKDLIGKSVGVSPGGTSRAILPQFLEVNGIQMSQIKEIAFEGMGRLNAVMMKELDAAVGPYNEYVPLIESKGHKVNALKFFEWNLPILGFGIIANNKMISENPDLIKRFLGATTLSIKYTLDHPDEAIKAMAKGYMKPQPELWAKDWELLVEMTKSKYSKGEPMGWNYEEEWNQTKDYLVRFEDKGFAEVPISKFYTNDFIGN